MPGGGVELPPSKLRLEDVSVPAAVRSLARKQKKRRRFRVRGQV